MIFRGVQGRRDRACDQFARESNERILRQPPQKVLVRAMRNVTEPNRPSPAFLTIPSSSTASSSTPSSSLLVFLLFQGNLFLRCLSTSSLNLVRLLLLLLLLLLLSPPPPSCSPFQTFESLLRDRSKARLTIRLFPRATREGEDKPGICRRDVQFLCARRRGRGRMGRRVVNRWSNGA